MHSDIMARKTGRRFRGLFICAFSLLCLPCHITAQSLEDSVYGVGLQAQAVGQWQEALQDWSRAASLPSAKPDPRIGVAYIGLATSQNLQTYYPMASKLYFWGFTTKDLARFHKSIQQEIDRLGPLIGDKSHREWSHEFKEGNPAVLDSIRGFWIRNDPLPSTPENERLIEHWQRIAYARAHFTKNRHSVYGTDPRGTIYVKYGSPDFVRKGRLLFDRPFVTNLAEEIENPLTGGSVHISKTIQFLIRISELKYFYPAEYEIWIYRNLSDANPDGNIYLFGNLRAGGYRELSGVEEFIPDNAFFTSDAIAAAQLTGKPTKGGSSTSPPPPPNFTPGTLLQVMYYQELSTKARFFGNIYDDMMGVYTTPPRSTPSDASYLRHRNHVKLEQQYFRSPKQTTAYTSRLTPLPVRLRLFRMLDPKNRPTLLVFSYSQPQNVLVAQYLKDHKVHQTALIHYVAAWDSTWHLAKQKKELGPVDVNDFLNDSTLNYTRTDALLPESSGGHLVFSARLLNFDAKAGTDSLSGLSHQLMAAGHINRLMPTPLSSNPVHLEMSDPVIGYDKSTASMSVDSMFVPFYVPPQNEIAYGKDIRLHYELYHLKPDSNGVAHYTLHYTLDLEKTYRLKKGEPKGKTHASLSLEMSAMGSRSARNLDIKVEDFVPGRYRLTLAATDPRGRQISRQVEFRIMEHVKN